MTMRKKTAATVKVRSAWRCPKCGHKVATAECYGCLVEEASEKKRKLPASEGKTIQD